MNTSPSSHSTFVTLMACFFIALVVGSIGFYQWRLYQLKNAISLTESRIKTKQSSVESLAGGVSFSEFLQAFESVENARDYRIQWSEVASFVLAFESPTMRFTNFSSTESQQISVTATAPTMRDVQTLLQKIQTQSAKASNLFLTSLRKQKNSAGVDEYGFVFTFQFLSS